MTYTRPMFPPVDQARRRFLTVAVGASVASVGTLAVAAMPATAPDSPACAVDPSTMPHPDAKLLELGFEYERLWAIEEPLEEESEQLWNAADRLSYEKLGVDPDDKEACRAAAIDRRDEWLEARELADEELGYSKAWRKWNRASSKTERIGKKILKIAPNTMAGLLVRIRVIETHEGELLAVEPAEQLLAEIRGFAKRDAGPANGGTA